MSVTSYADDGFRSRHFRKVSIGSCQKDGPAGIATHTRLGGVVLTSVLNLTYVASWPFGMLLADVARHGTLLPIQTLNMRSSASVVSR